TQRKTNTNGNNPVEIIGEVFSAHSGISQRSLRLKAFDCCNHSRLSAKCDGHPMTPKSESRPLAKFAPALFLLTISFIINYVDRGNISLAGQLIKHEFGLSNLALGMRFAAFFCTYTAM